MFSYTTFIEQMRAKPEHERKRIVIIVSATFTVLVALFWLLANISSGSFFARVGAPASPAPISGVAGAGAALFAPDTSEARLEAVVPVQAEEPEPVVESPTVIPF